MSGYARNGTRLERKYSPDQERDEAGRFGAGSGAPVVSKTSAGVLVHNSTDTTPKDFHSDSHYFSSQKEAITKANSLAKSNPKLQVHVLPLSPKMSEMLGHTHQIVYHSKT